ncbi:MAG: SpoIIE family protein phosphatase [Agathobacter sp.]|nr:SpoIIE family protein phosphatase [Agathobacter sp.]
METSVAGKEILRKGVQIILGYICALPSFMGYHPLIPVYFSLCCLEKKNVVLVYGAVILGLINQMKFAAIFKYGILMLVIGMAIYFYRWANGHCSGLAAGILAGGSVLAMNYSGMFFAVESSNELLLGASEALATAGLAGGLHYGIEYVREIYGIKKRRKEPVIPEAEIKENNTAGQMEALASAVDGLSGVFSMIAPKESSELSDQAGILQEAVTGKLCMSCGGCAICWEQNQNYLQERIDRMVKAVMNHESRESIVEEKYLEHCPQYADMVEEAIAAFGRIELNQAWYKRLLENRQVIARQLDAVVELMGEWTREEKSLDKQESRLLAKVAVELQEKGVVPQVIHLYEDDQGRRYFKAYLSSKWGGGIPSRNCLKAFEKVTGKSLRLDKEARAMVSQEGAGLIIYEDVRYFTLPGIATRKKDTSPENGDNFVFFDMDCGHHYVALSDGMGSGKQASQESELVVELLEKLMRAGFRKEVAIQMMNSAMVLQSRQESYSTLDLADLDLYTGEVTLTKVGAACSFIKRGEDIEVLSAGSLPAGAVPGEKPGEISSALKHGDFLVMITDGVLEYLHVKEPVQVLSDMIAKINTDNAGALAKNILDSVLLHTGGYAQDDMTVLVTGIWEK